MIKNIVFDIGNVLMEFNPIEYLKGLGYSKEEAKDLIECIFSSEEWILLDRGSLEEEKAIEIFCSRAPKLQEEIKRVMNSWVDMLLPMEETIELLKELKNNGYNIYLLSNYHRKAFKITKDRNQFFDLVDGYVISYERHFIKPQREIYIELLDKYSLKAQETVFIDDVEANILGAEEVGIKGILFENMVELIRNLKELNIKI